MEATYVQAYNKDDLNPYFEDQTAVEPTSERRNIKDIIDHLSFALISRGNESYGSYNYTTNTEETDLPCFKLNTHRNLILDKGFRKKIAIYGLFKNLFKNLNPDEGLICFLAEDNSRVCINRNDLINREYIFDLPNYFQSEFTEELYEFKYKDLDFPVIPEPNRKYKIKAKIRKVYSGESNPPLDLEL